MLAELVVPYPALVEWELLLANLPRILRLSYMERVTVPKIATVLKNKRKFCIYLFISGESLIRMSIIPRLILIERSQ